MQTNPAPPSGSAADGKVTDGTNADGKSAEGTTVAGSADEPSVAASLPEESSDELSTDSEAGEGEAEVWADARRQVSLTRAALAVAQHKPNIGRAWAEPVVAQLRIKDKAKRQALAADAAEAERLAAEAAELKANGMGDDDDDGDGKKKAGGDDDDDDDDDDSDGEDNGEIMASAMVGSRAKAKVAGSRRTWLAVETLARVAEAEGRYDDADRLLADASPGIDAATNWCVCVIVNKSKHSHRSLCGMFTAGFLVLLVFYFLIILFDCTIFHLYGPPFLIVCPLFRVAYLQVASRRSAHFWLLAEGSGAASRTRQEEPVGCFKSQTRPRARRGGLGGC